MASTLHVHSDPTLCLHGLEDLGTRGIISIKGDIKRAFDYDRESSETADRVIMSAELQELKKALAESPPPRPGHA
jgi:hypothetical protein